MQVRHYRQSNDENRCHFAGCQRSGSACELVPEDRRRHSHTAQTAGRSCGYLFYSTMRSHIHCFSFFFVRWRRARYMYASLTFPLKGIHPKADLPKYVTPSRTLVNQHKNHPITPNRDVRI